MARICQICGKQPSSGFNVSHSHRRTKRRFLPNLQRVRVQGQHARLRLRVCTCCLKAGKVLRAG